MKTNLVLLAPGRRRPSSTTRPCSSLALALASPSPSTSFDNRLYKLHGVTAIASSKR